MITYVEHYRRQMLRLSIHVGGTVYVVPRDSRREPFTAKVIKIGPKYITIDSVYKGDSKFTHHKYTNICTDGIEKYTLYATKEEYDSCNMLLSEIRGLANDIQVKLRYMSPATLCRINDIVEQTVIND